MHVDAHRLEFVPRLVIRFRAALIAAVAVLALVATCRPAAGGDFGHTTVGASGQNVVADKQIAMQVTLAEDGTLQSISAYVKGPPPKDIRFALYSDSGGEPDTLLVETPVDGIASSSYYWHTINTPPMALTAGTYWLAVAFEVSTEYYKYDSGSGAVRYRDHDACASGFLGTWGTSDASYTREISIYGTYTTGAGPTIFGYDTIGGTTESRAQFTQIGSLFTMPEEGTVESITAYVGGFANKHARYALYGDSGSEPGALLAETANANTSAGMEWLEIDLPDTWIAAGDYWLALTLDITLLEYAHETSGGSTREVRHNALLNGYLHPWGTSDASNSRRVSIYATYTAGPPPWMFTDVSSATGFDLQTTTSEGAGSGLHWGDLDDDGDLDVIITGAQSRKLISVSEGASFSASTFGTGTSDRQGGLVDIDNDGDLDFWHRANTLYENDGTASFTSAGDLGFSDPGDTEGAAVADVDRDGWAEPVNFATDGNWIGHHQRALPVVLTGTADTSYGMNDVGDTGDGDYVSSADVNGDGDLDFFYHYGGGMLFLSDGDGTYTESSSGIAVTTGPSDKIGSAWGDYDNDGDVDLFVPRHDAGSPGYLWRNDGGTFTDVASAAGITDATGQRSATWGDYDNDGDLDLYIVSHAAAANVLYNNSGGGVFTAVSVGADATGTGHDAAFVDYDNDGDLDLAVTQQSATNTLLRNDTDDTDYLKVRVVGWGAWGTNKAGIGVRIDLYDSTATTLLARRDVGVARGYGGTEPPWVHFGGVTASSTYVVRAHFATGVVDTTVVPAATSTTIGSTTIAQMLTITEPQPDKQVIWWQEVDPGSP